MKSKIKFIIIIFVTFIILSCNDDNGIGPCVHTYKEPILNITSLRDTVNSNHPRFIILRDLTLMALKNMELIH